MISNESVITHDPYYQIPVKQYTVKSYYSHNITITSTDRMSNTVDGVVTKSNSCKRNAGHLPPISYCLCTCTSKTNQSFVSTVDSSRPNEVQQSTTHDDDENIIQTSSCDAKIQSSNTKCNKLTPVSSEEDLTKFVTKDRCSNERDTIDLIPASPTPLPDPEEDQSPDEFLIKLVKAQYGLDLEAKPALSLQGFFLEVSEAQMACYNTEVVSTVRNNDLDRLKQLHVQGQQMDCFNRFGESLLNIACRRGFEDIVAYLLEQESVSVRHCDDCGRTPLHDACWHPTPQLTICKWIMERDPVLFFTTDRRGCTAFQYARPEHWPIWRKFLMDNRKSLEGLTNPGIRSRLENA